MGWCEIGGRNLCPSKVLAQAVLSNFVILTAVVGPNRGRQKRGKSKSNIHVHSVHEADNLQLADLPGTTKQNQKKKKS